ncbi:WcbI family polysaccharide biosynthesis putative acetyltransferase [Ensifer sp. SL37]|uniref:WcbI family polysaccharide biosynthesis putative acetyltransferase n=1 Tax=Ensifer sp. SL37 TaxID=2995137 RepID=UPI0022751DC3|nr:WcbI family polysaccharide biosynthesis putative acetyltransferase [Ensifer sp. SL37]MCY1741149.1 WcbI family polysaccharide biosynthesis putative acetyltransferase [Ensifer sp. SL37]
MVVSNCHTEGLANSLRLLTTGITIHAPDVWEVIHNQQKYIDVYRAYDRVIIAPEVEQFDELNGFDFGSVKRLHKIPTFWFSAYHPDSMYIQNGDTKMKGPLDVYHSAIAVSAYQKGLGVDDTLKLFNGDTYERVGYLDYWDAQRGELLKRFAAHGIDISRALLKWSRGNCFMHSVDHPTIDPIYDVARIFLQSIDVPAAETRIVPPDYLKYPPKFAIYPEIGESLGVRGSYLFKTEGAGTIDLRHFVKASFDLYDTLPADLVKVSTDKKNVFDYVMAS